MSVFLESEVQRLRHQVNILQTRFDQMFKIGLTTLPTDELGGTALVQIQHNRFETHNVQFVQQFGFVSSPPLGSSMLTLAISGDASRKLALGSHNDALRPKNTPSGGTLIHDATGTMIALPNNGSVIISIGGTAILTINATGLHVTGLITATGAISAGQGGADQVTVQGHRHGTGSPAAGTSPPSAGT